MAHRAISRGIAAGAATTFTVGAFALLTGGIANAAPQTITWDDGKTHFTRIVSNTTPAAGDTVTISTRWERTDANWEKLNWVREWHPACLTYVPGSATVTDAAGTHNIEPFVETQSDYTAVDFVTLGYQPTAKRYEDAPLLSTQYKVGNDCSRADALTTGMSYLGSRGAGTYTSKGPLVTVAKNTTTTSLAAVGGATAGQASTLTATVTGGAPGDTVEFYDGATKIGTGTLAANGTATATWTPELPGSHGLSAKYLVTPAANASLSGVQYVQVAPSGSTHTTTLAPVAGATVGTATTLTATVAPGNAGGTVEFKDGATVIGTAALGPDGTATQAWTPTAAGDRTITATYNGPGGITSSAQATVAVAAATGDGSSTGSLGSLFGS
ncbi:Ig-like domain repeat protein [Rhodococcus sp. NPDC127528]|uniref:Ig-like domain repeat protein n=1 Tax=unclassified Rhodococcus (in: high G+C Gram-positive bacteria) TaxID=192944 RepID=UPI00362B097D